MAESPQPAFYSIGGSLERAGRSIVFRAARQSRSGRRASQDGAGEDSTPARALPVI